MFSKENLHFICDNASSIVCNVWLSICYPVALHDLYKNDIEIGEHEILVFSSILGLSYLQFSNLFSKNKDIDTDNIQSYVRSTFVERKDNKGQIDLEMLYLTWPPYYFLLV